MRRYLIVIEQTTTGFSAYSPDVPGCISAGRTREEVEATMRETIELHLDGLRQDGVPIPMPSASAAYVDVAA